MCDKNHKLTKFLIVKNNFVEINLRRKSNVSKRLGKLKGTDGKRKKGTG